MISNVNALEIQCKRAPNTSSGKFQRGPCAVKISRYMNTNHTSPYLSAQQPTLVKTNEEYDDDWRLEETFEKTHRRKAKYMFTYIATQPQDDGEDRQRRC